MLENAPKDGFRYKGSPSIGSLNVEFCFGVFLREIAFLAYLYCEGDFNFSRRL